MIHPTPAKFLVDSRPGRFSYTLTYITILVSIHRRIHPISRGRPPQGLNQGVEAFRTNDATRARRASAGQVPVVGAQKYIYVRSVRVLPLSAFIYTGRNVDTS
jgi:hypothetical protein